MGTTGGKEQTSGTWQAESRIWHPLDTVSEDLTCGGTVERVTGIEPAWPAWKAGALPLSYTRVRHGPA